MSKNKIILFSSFICAAAMLVVYGCQKVPKGFISDNIFYAVNPFSVPQGITTVSAPLVIDGSTNPMNVKLLAIRDLSTGKPVDQMFLSPDTILVYTGAITYADSTIALLNAKLKDSTVAPFSVNPIGGRLQFTQATKFIPQGQYNIDIQASNIRGSKIINNACQINLVSASVDSLNYTAYSQVDSTGNNFYSDPASNLKIDIRRDAAGPNKIILIWKDKNGQAFNPANGEVIPRPARPDFAGWDPYYPQVKTDTSLEFNYPGGVPQFPVFSNPNNYPWAGNGLMYYRVLWNHTDIGLSLNTTAGIIYYATKGTFYVTFNLTDVARIP